jgi:hypothetical protein
MRLSRAIRPLPAAVLTMGLALGPLLAGCGEEEPAPQSEPANDVTSSQPTSQPSEPAEEAVAGATLDITVAGEQVSPKAQTLNLAVGDTLTLRITSDRPGELHVHSNPEQTVGFAQGATTRQVTIDKPGQVDVEEHESGVLVARLLVQ